MNSKEQEFYDMIVPIQKQINESKEKMMELYLNIEGDSSINDKNFDKIERIHAALLLIIDEL